MASLISVGVIAENRRARHDYEILETLEAGLVLTGSEVKSLRQGRASIAESYAGEVGGALMLINATIPIYEGARDNHDPKRHRALLVSKKERNKLLGQIGRDGMTAVPLKLYFNQRGLAKLLLGLAAGRKNTISAKPSSNAIGPPKSTPAQGRPISASTASKTASNIASVSRPVCVL